MGHGCHICDTPNGCECDKLTKEEKTRRESLIGSFPTIITNHTTVIQLAQMLARHSVMVLTVSAGFGHVVVRAERIGQQNLFGNGVDLSTALENLREKLT